MNDLSLQLNESEKAALIEQYQPYVRKLASQVYHQFGGSFEIDEIISFGTLGLVEAADRFNPQRSVSFVTFAHYRIRGAIFDGLNQMGLPRQSSSSGSVSTFEKVANAEIQLAGDDEINTINRSSDDLESEIASVTRVIDNLIPAYLLSLDSEEAREAVDENAEQDFRQLETNDLLNVVRQVVEELPPDERDLLKAIYYQGISMSDWAKKNNITRSWVSRLHTRTIQNVRNRLRDKKVLAE